LKIIQGFSPAEIIFCKQSRPFFEKLLDGAYNTFALDDWVYSFDYGYEKLINQFKTASVKGFGIEGMGEAVMAAGAILHYLDDTEHKDTSHITSISRIDEDKYVWLDKFTIRNLELVNAQQDGGVPLLEILDHTVTAMGSRQLRKWMILPLKEINAINERLLIVDTFFKDLSLGERVIESLRQISDLERLISKVAVNRISPRELCQLKRSLNFISPIKEALSTHTCDALRAMGEQLHPCVDLIEKVETSLEMTRLFPAVREV
jgi:DNA mismatch repair protein MutS